MRSDRLKELREQAGHTQESLSDYLGRDIKQIWRWETGKVVPSSQVIIELAKTFQVSADYLLGLSDIPNGIMGNSELSDGEAELIKTFRRLGDDDQNMVYMVVHTIQVSLEGRFGHEPNVHPREKS